LFIQPQEQID